MPKIPPNEPLRPVRWAIAAALPASTLEAIALHQLPEYMRWTTISGGAMSALLVGDYDTDDELAREIANEHETSVYLLDFDDEGTSIDEYAPGAKRAKRKRGAPAAFLRERGIVVPGYGPRPSPVRIVVVVEGATPEQVRRVYENETMRFELHPRGTLVLGDPRLGDLRYAEELGGPVYALHYNIEDGEFWCDVRRRGDVKPLKFETGRIVNAHLYTIVDSVLGESTPLGICRALGVPPEVLGMPAS